MRKKILFLFLTLGAFHVQNLNAQTLNGADASKIVSGSERVVLNPSTKQPIYVEFPSGKGPKAVDFEPWLKRNLNLSPSLGLTLINAEKDPIGFEHFRYGQTFNGLPINHSMLIVHVKNGLVVSFNGEYVTILSVKTDAALAESKALEIAKKSIGAKVYKWELAGEEAFIKREQNDPKATFFPTGTKMLAKNKRAEYVLAYRFDIYAHAPASRQYVYVDASTGEVVGSEERIHETNAAGTATTAYSGVRGITTDHIGATYRLQETGRGLGIKTFNMKNAGSNFGAAVDFTDSDNNWNNVNASLDQYATDVHWGAEKTYDYYKVKHLRNSIDGAGFALLNYVHTDLILQGHGFTNNINAYWDGDRMVFGDGGVGYTPLTSLDITGHEITHGLTEKTANLFYGNESGALNEGFSDIFGTAIEFYGKPGNAGNWTIGEEVGPKPFRSMSNPNLYGCPDTYKGDNWFFGNGDNGGVHFNSGVLNYWFYLLCQGGTGTNDNGNAYKVSAIGMSKATLIAYQTLTSYLTPNSNYAQARLFSIQVVTNLYGACSAEAIAVTNAWFAVGIGSGILPAVITSASPLSVCPGHGVFLSATLGASSYQWKLNGVDIPQATFSSYSVFAPGSYTVATTSSCGGSYTSLPAVVTYITPYTSTIAPAGSVKACFGSSYGLTATTNAGNQLQWNKDGVPIPGATSATYLASSTGSYTVTSSATPYPALTYSNTTPAILPANDLGCEGNYSDISISGVANSYLSSGISVKMNITQENAMQLNIFLETPSGEVLALVKTQPVYHFNFVNTVFSDGGVPLNTGGGFFTGNFKPCPLALSFCSTTSTKTTFGSLGATGRINPNGTWRLRVYNLSGFEGSIDNWEISFASYTVPAVNCPVTSPATLVTILPVFNPGTIASGDQSSCLPFDPNPITLSVNPSGSGAYKYQWYYWNNPTITVPLDVTSGTTSFTDTRFFGTSLDGSGISFDPTTAGNAPGRTWAVAIVGISQGTTPGCGEGQKAFSQRRHTVQNCTFSPGVLAFTNQTLCNPADPAAITFSYAASAGSTFQWYFKDGTVAAPANAAPTTGWTSIAGATSNSYDPPAGLTISRTYACRVIYGANNQWATGAQQTTVLHTVNLGSITSGDQTLCANGDPAPITMAVDPSGSASFTYKWYYKGSTAAACPVGNSLVGWVATAGITNTYDPQSAGAAGRTFALFVTPSGAPTCGTPGWATSCRKVFVGACREAVNPGADAEDAQSVTFQSPALEQNLPNPWTEHTTFSVFLPENAKDAEIRISGLDGRLHQVIPIIGTGNQQVEMIKGDLPDGLYMYSLWTNSQPVAIKKMVLIR